MSHLGPKRLTMCLHERQPGQSRTCPGDCHSEPVHQLASGLAGNHAERIERHTVLRISETASRENWHLPALLGMFGVVATASGFLIQRQHDRIVARMGLDQISTGQSDKHPQQAVVQLGNIVVPVVRANVSLRRTGNRQGKRRWTLRSARIDGDGTDSLLPTWHDPLRRSATFQTRKGPTKGNRPQMTGTISSIHIPSATMPRAEP